MRAYKTVVWDGQEYSVPVEMKWLTVDSDGEIAVWSCKPAVCLYQSGGTHGFWRKVVLPSQVITLAEGEDCPTWRESLTEI